MIVYIAERFVINGKQETDWDKAKRTWSRDFEISSSPWAELRKQVS